MNTAPHTKKGVMNNKPLTQMFASTDNDFNPDAIKNYTIHQVYQQRNINDKATPFQEKIIN